MTSHPNTVPPDVSIAVLATREPSLIRACLRSISATVPDGIDVEIIVVLGAASPEVEAEVAQAAGVRVIRSDVNTGTALACNLAFEASRAPLVFSLHEDTELLPGCVPRLLQTAGEEPRAGAIGTRVLNPDGSLQHLGAALWRSGDLTPLVEATAPTLAQADHPFRVGITAASAMLVRRAAWEAVGGFDEGYFPFTYVDVDFSMALRAHGYDVLVEPRAAIKHRRGASQGPGGGALSTSRFRDWVFERHRDRLLRKWSAVAPTLPSRPDGVSRTEVAPEVVSLALPPAVDGPIPDAPRAGRGLSRPGEDSLAEDGSISASMRRRLLDVEHTVLDAFAHDLASENADRAEEIRSMWAALQDARAYNEDIYAQHTVTSRRLADLISENAAQAWQISTTQTALETAGTRIAALARHVAELESEAEWLKRRSAVYEQIVSGRWWRLRSVIYRLLGRQA